MQIFIKNLQVFNFSRSVSKFWVLQGNIYVVMATTSQLGDSLSGHTLSEIQTLRYSMS